MEGYTQLRVDLEDWEGVKSYATYGVFKVADAGDKYRLTVENFNGTEGKRVQMPGIHILNFWICPNNQNN